MKFFNNFIAKTDNRKYNTWCKYTTRIDTYGCGCQHECKYCYSKGLLDFRKNWNQVPKIAPITAIYEAVQSLDKNTVVRMGGMSDCFQPIEKQSRVTMETIKMLNQFKMNYLIVTKSSLVSSDEYIKLYNKELAHFQITITNTNDNDCLKYENASLISERIKAVEILQSCGFDVAVRLSPFIDGYVDYKILNRIKCSKILIEFLKANHFTKKWFDIDYSKHNLKYGGYCNLQLEYKVNMVKNIDFEQMTVGEYVEDHYKYFSENFNYNKNDCCNLSLIKQKQECEQLTLTL